MPRKKIYGFYHVLLVNHWQEIVTEQITLLLTSGLYEASESIFIGALGKKKELSRLRQLFKVYPKFIIEYHSDNIEEYEFATLKILKKKSSAESFYGYYLHTKGVSWDKKHPKAYKGGNCWRQSMGYFLADRWKDNLYNLEIGYDLSGSQLLSARRSPAFQEHYSGNFFWFNSDHVKLLKPVESLNLKNRWEAEMYICSYYPIAATLNQERIDYNTNKIWKDAP